MSFFLLTFFVVSAILFSALLVENPTLAAKRGLYHEPSEIGSNAEDNSNAHLQIQDTTP